MESSKAALPETWTPPRPTKYAEPNCLVYRDNNDIEHQIYTPKGTFKVARDHALNERWDELKKFAPYSKIFTFWLPIRHCTLISIFN